jgi:hypothetical protein
MKILSLVLFFLLAAAGSVKAAVSFGFNISLGRPVYYQHPSYGLCVVQYAHHPHYGWILVKMEPVYRYRARHRPEYIVVQPTAPIWQAPGYQPYYHYPDPRYSGYYAPRSGVVQVPSQGYWQNYGHAPARPYVREAPPQSYWQR